MEAPEGGSLYTDAYSGRTSLSVSGKSPGSVTVTAVGAGGNYFLFHPLTLLSGGYISDEDYMADRVVLDAQTAFNLFGSSDVAGMEVTINGRTSPSRAWCRARRISRRTPPLLPGTKPRAIQAVRARPQP